MNKLEKIALIGTTILTLFSCNKNDETNENGIKKHPSLKPIKEYNYVEVSLVDKSVYDNGLTGYDFNNDGRLDFVGINHFGDIILYEASSKYNEKDPMPGYKIKGVIGKAPKIHSLYARIVINDGKLDLVIFHGDGQAHLYKNKK